MKPHLGNPGGRTGGIAADAVIAAVAGSALLIAALLVPMLL